MYINQFSWKWPPLKKTTPEEEEEGGDHGHGHDDILESANDMDIQLIQE